jgi:Flp pilus assembly protein TadD
MNRPDSSATFIEILVKDSPGPRSWARAGDAYYEAYGMEADPSQRSEYATRAREYYLMVLEQEPSNLGIKNRVAMTWLASSSPMQGILTLREIIQEDPDNAQALFNLGVLSMQSGQYDKAVGRFEQLVALDPKNIEAHFFLGVSHLELGNKAEARKEFEFVKENGNDPAVISDAESYLESI